MYIGMQTSKRKMKGKLTNKSPGLFQPARSFAPLRACPELAEGVTVLR